MLTSTQNKLERNQKTHAWTLPYLQSGRSHKSTSDNYAARYNSNLSSTVMNTSTQCVSHHQQLNRLLPFHSLDNDAAGMLA